MKFGDKGTTFNSKFKIESRKSEKTQAWKASRLSLAIKRQFIQIFVKVTLEQTVLYYSVLFKFGLSVKHSLFVTDATCIIKQRPFITTQIGINTFSPILHRHRYMPFCSTFCKLQYSRNNTPHILQFRLLQIILGN